VLEEAVKGNLIPRNPLGVDCVLMAHRSSEKPPTTSTGGIRCADLRITLRFEPTRPEVDAKGGEE
jgi:hypothetical protein